MLISITMVPTELVSMPKWTVAAFISHLPGEAISADVTALAPAKDTEADLSATVSTPTVAR